MVKATTNKKNDDVLDDFKAWLKANKNLKEQIEKELSRDE